MGKIEKKGRKEIKGKRRRERSRKLGERQTDKEFLEHTRDRQR